MKRTPTMWNKTTQLISWVISLSLLLGIGSLLALLGWEQSIEIESILLVSTQVGTTLYGLSLLALQAITWKQKGFHRQLMPPLILGTAIAGSSLFESQLSRHLSEVLPQLPLHACLFTLAITIQGITLITQLSRIIPWIETHCIKRLNPGMLLVSTFSLLILLGTLLLKMPQASVHYLPWLDALFTSTSAVCVTGLIVVDTATEFTFLGQSIILVLIQIGGLGIMTLTFFIALLVGRGMRLSSRIVLSELLSQENVHRLGIILSSVIGFTLFLELIGSTLIYQQLQRTWVGPEPLIWVALFHSISAFCNAGFSIFSLGLADSRVCNNIPIQGIIVSLIILGGLGFPVIMDITRLLCKNPFSSSNRRKFSLSLHSRLVLILTAILIFGGTLLITMGELNSHSSSIGRLLWQSLFNAISARTAGFNTTNISELSGAATCIMLVLMFIGGSPGGMAGGIKTTTFFIACLNLRRILLRKKELNLFNRRIEERTCNRAFAIVLLSQLWILLITALLLLAEPQTLFIDALFEVVSAFATVGLSHGLTSELGSIAKLLIIITMLVGRVGILSFFFGIIPIQEDLHARLPSGHINID